MQQSRSPVYVGGAEEDASSQAEFELVTAEKRDSLLEEIRTGRRQLHNSVDERFVAAAFLGHTGIWKGDFSDRHGAVFETYALPEDLYSGTARRRTRSLILHPATIGCLADMISLMALSVLAVPCACDQSSFYCTHLQVLVLWACVALRIYVMAVFKYSYICAWWEHLLETVNAIAWGAVISMLWLWHVFEEISFAFVSAAFQHALIATSISLAMCSVVASVFAKYKLSRVMWERKHALRGTALHVALAAVRWRRSVAQRNRAHQERDEQEEHMATREVELAAATTTMNPLRMRGQSPDRPENTSELVFWESPLLRRDRHTSIVMAVSDPTQGDRGGDDTTMWTANPVMVETVTHDTTTSETNSIEALSALADSLAIIVGSNAEEEGSAHRYFDASALQQRRDAVEQLVQLGELTYEEAALVHQAQSDEEAVSAIRNAAEALLARKVEATDSWRDRRASLTSLDPALHIKRIISQADKFASMLRAARSRLRPTGQALWIDEQRPHPIA